MSRHQSIPTKDADADTSVIGRLSILFFEKGSRHKKGKTDGQQQRRDRHRAVGNLSNAAWTATANGGWITLTPAAGKGNGAK